MTQCKRQSWFVLVENKTWDLPCHWASCWFTFTPVIKIWKEQAPFQFLRTRNQCFFWGQTNAIVSCCILQNGLASFSFFWSIKNSRIQFPCSHFCFFHHFQYILDHFYLHFVKFSRKSKTKTVSKMPKGNVNSTSTYSLNRKRERERQRGKKTALDRVNWKSV